MIRNTFFSLTLLFNALWFPLVDGSTVEEHQNRMLTSENLEQPAGAIKQIEPYRTFITIEKYVLAHNGDLESPISNVRLQVFPPKLDPKSDKQVSFNLPAGGHYWAVGNGQEQEIKKTFELPWEYVQNDGFEMTIQMDRKSAWVKPCKIQVKSLSQFNRKYVCKTDVAWQREKGIPEEQWHREAVEIRVFTDKNSPQSQVPQNALAIRSEM